MANSSPSARLPSAEWLEVIFCMSDWDYFKEHKLWRIFPESWDCPDGAKSKGSREQQGVLVEESPSKHTKVAKILSRTQQHMTKRIQFPRSNEAERQTRRDVTSIMRTLCFMSIITLRLFFYIAFINSSPDLLRLKAKNKSNAPTIEKEKSQNSHRTVNSPFYRSIKWLDRLPA